MSLKWWWTSRPAPLNNVYKQFTLMGAEWKACNNWSFAKNIKTQVQTRTWHWEFPNDAIKGDGKIIYSLYSRGPKWHQIKTNWYWWSFGDCQMEIRMSFHPVKGIPMENSTTLFNWLVFGRMRAVVKRGRSNRFEPCLHMHEGIRRTTTTERTSETLGTLLLLHLQEQHLR